ncbi:MAG: DUF2157 domain-containing protein [Verrucomicrobia bacterium]|nr:DUF2157 domain-containing protein [Verrucomicrobiota bacterium]
MNKKALRWLYAELPTLVSSGVVSPEVAERIRKHYSEPEAQGSGRHWLITLFAIIGAALIGGGIILLLAHNWEELTRPMRAAISVAPLLLTQALGAWVLWKRAESTAWREGVGTSLTLAIGSSIALIAQTYNLGGTFPDFMFAWTLLALPVAYLLRATLPALLYLVGVTIWSGSVMDEGSKSLWFWPLVGVALPYLWMTARENRYHPRPLLVCWVLSIVGAIGAGFGAHRLLDEFSWWTVLFGGLFAVWWLVGSRWYGEASRVWQRPFQIVGGLGLWVMSLVLTFSDPWEEVSRHVWWGHMHHNPAEWIGALVWPVAAVALWVAAWRRREVSELLLGAMPVLAVIGQALAVHDMEVAAAVLFNVYVLVVAVTLIASGVKVQRLGIINAGMLLLSALILCRFFDADLGFVARGIAFILIGTGFLVTNLVLLRRKGAAQ